jgi:DNA-binding NtrC family response regulator
MTSSRVAVAEPSVLPDMGQVLVVEDERRLRDVLIANIREMGMDPTGAWTAEQALQIMEKGSVPIVLLDLNLPGMNGMTLCETIHRRWPSTQVVVLTGFGDLNAAKRAIRLEVVDFLTKPCGMDDLEMALSRARSRFRERWIGSQPAMPREARAESAQARSSSPKSDSPAVPSLENAERDLIFAALERHGGNREAAAAELGISVRKLYYRLQQYHQKPAVTEQNAPLP